MINIKKLNYSDLIKIKLIKMNIEEQFPVKIKNILDNEYHSTFFYINKFDLSSHIIELWEEWQEIEVSVYRRYKNQSNNGLKKIITYSGTKKFFNEYVDAEIDLTESMEIWIFINTKINFNIQLEHMTINDN